MHRMLWNENVTQGKSRNSQLSKGAVSFGRQKGKCHRRVFVGEEKQSDCWKENEIELRSINSTLNESFAKAAIGSEQNNPSTDVIRLVSKPKSCGFSVVDPLLGCFENEQSPISPIERTTRYERRDSMQIHSKSCSVVVLNKNSQLRWEDAQGIVLRPMRGAVLLDNGSHS